MKDTSPDIVNMMIPAGDQRLIIGFSARLRWRSVAVSSLRRFGYSDAYLYVLQNSDGSGQPHIAKIGPTNEIDRERSAWRSVRGFIEMDDVLYSSDRESRRSGLCFRLKSKTGHDLEVAELDDYYLKALAGNSDSKIELMQHLHETYESLSGAHRQNLDGAASTYGKEFTKYLRRDKSPDRVKALFRCHKSPLEICGHIVPENPLILLPEILGRTTQGFSAGAVHGDLHLSNVVVSRGRPHLVDYAWAELGGHLTKDFVLMESSLRFMRFPGYIHPRILLQVDQQLNENWSVDFARGLLDQRFDREARVTLACMLDLVGEVRSRFESAVSTFGKAAGEWFREYFTGLYLILAGQQRYDTFPLLRTIVSLHQLRDWIQAE